MTNKSTFFGHSATVASIVWCTEGSLCIPGPLLVIWLTFSKRRLRQKTINWFIVNLAISDCCFALGIVFWGIFLWYPDSIYCKFTGFWSYFSALSSVCLPGFIALHRYVHVCCARPKGNVDYRSWFSKRNVVIINISTWLYSAVTFLPFALMDRLGPERLGGCGISADSNTFLIVYYNGMVSGAVFMSAATVIFCYTRLAAWIKRKQAELRTNQNRQIQNTINETSALLGMIWLICIITLVSLTPPAVVKTVLTFNPDIPFWFGRIFVTFLGVNNFCNSWVTLLVVKPYRRAFMQMRVSNLLPDAIRNDAAANMEI